MTSWISSLINQHDGCLQLVARQTSQGKVRQERLAQTVAHNAPMPSMNKDQLQHLAHRDAQLEHVRSERDIHFVQKEELLAQMRLLSSEAKTRKSRVVREAKQTQCKKFAETTYSTTEVKKPWTDNNKHDGDKRKQNSRICTSPTALKRRPSQ